MGNRYRLLDHTSDLMVEIEGSSLPDLLVNTCFCLFDTMLDLASVEERESRTLEVHSADRDELYLDWIRELLFVFSNGFVPARAEISGADDGPDARILATLHGETFDQVKHGLKLEIKTPTYHRYRLEKTGSGYRATVILDV